ncbi:histidine phosphatase family protein [Singulisphaera sp. PoT]|uniref:histidine phosphatase family protein n=1 Tax=Singulisphaera sp. PoT TaxID=3411797 RepID=UPI003BF48F21
MNSPLPEVFLVRHGETEWSISRQHTGRTDIPLTSAGEANARGLGTRLQPVAFNHVFVSPLLRARQTCELAGLGEKAVVDRDLMEWDYGAFEGMRTDEIRQTRPEWDLFRDGCPDGESLEAIAARADRVVARLRECEGKTLVFSHSHFLRVLATRWLGCPAGNARHLVLQTGGLSIVGYEHDVTEPAIRLWNDTGHLPL